MRMPNGAFAIEDHNQRHPTKLEETDLLPVQQGDSVFRIRQSDKRKPFCPPIQTEGRRSIRTHGNNRRIPLHELLMVVPQARQLRAAVGSEEPPQECQDDRPAAVV